jgi:hypothetical protein
MELVGHGAVLARYNVLVQRSNRVRGLLAMQRRVVRTPSESGYTESSCRGLLLQFFEMCGLLLSLNSRFISAPCSDVYEGLPGRSFNGSGLTEDRCDGR